MGIWQFASRLTPVPDQFKLSLNEGNTEEVVFEGIILKREDQNPTGSLKDRGMAYLLSWAQSRGYKDFVLSSSGNAAISAAAYCRQGGMRLSVFVSPRINKGKLKKLKEGNVNMHFSPRPISEAVKFAKERGCFNLRPSLNEFGSEGYQTIAFELSQNQKVVDDIFLPVSSGITLVGLADGFKKEGFLPKIHLCQSSFLFPLAACFDQDFTPEKKSLAEALVAKTTPLKNEIIKLVEESGGSGWVIGNAEILLAEEKLRKGGIETSAEGALAYAAIDKVRKKGWKLGKTVCLLTGRRY